MGTQESESEVGVSCGDCGGLGENVRKGKERGVEKGQLETGGCERGRGEGKRLLSNSPRHSLFWE